MLNKGVDGFVYDDQGRVCGVRSGDEVAKCKMVICDPSYAEPTRTEVRGQVIRAICILGAPIPETKKSGRQTCIVLSNHFASEAAQAKE